MKKTTAGRIKDETSGRETDKVAQTKMDEEREVKEVRKGSTIIRENEKTTHDSQNQRRTEVKTGQRDVKWTVRKLS